MGFVMERQYIKDLKEGSIVRGRFVVKDKEPPKDYRNKDGKYFFIEVGDKTGSMNLRYWGGADAEKVEKLYEDIGIGDVISITGIVGYDKFEDILVINLNEGMHVLKKCELLDGEEEELLPKSKMDQKELMNEVVDAIASVKNKYIQNLLKEFFRDKEFIEKFKKSPESIAHNHNYISGTLEHVVSTIRIVNAIASFYKELDRDILIAGAILHDIGKICEYKYKTTIEATEEGKFLGHVFIGNLMLHEKIKSIEGFPKEIEMKLSHVIMTHHSNDELKSLKTAEACAIRFAVELDANVKEYIQAIEAGRAYGEEWVYNRGLGSSLYLK
ncbi:MAG: HD domain-containing protein [Candidatus Thermoplasmatota archaeon]